jgi:hypothetical protein
MRLLDFLSDCPYIEPANMLFYATILVDLCAMAATLWMAFYLFARGFPRIITLRAVVVLWTLSFFFYGAYNNVFYQVTGTAAWRAVLLVIGLGSWYSVTFNLMSEYSQKRYRLFEWGIYALGAVTLLLLLRPDTFTGEIGNAIYVAHMSSGWTYRVYSLYQFLASFGIMLNLLVGDRVGLTSRGKYFLVASIFPVVAVIYGVASLGSKTPSPRIVQDTLAFCGVFILSLSVARHQTLTERRTTFQDFPLTTLSTLGLTAITVFFAWKKGIPVADLVTVAGFIIFAVGIYDLTREFLERLRVRGEGAFRRQLHQIESLNESAFRVRLQEALDLLCQTINAPSGLIAVRAGDEFLVAASRHSLPIENRISAELLYCEEISLLKDGRIRDLEWIAPSFEGQTQVAVVGIGKPSSKLYDYSTGDLEVLEEVADQVGTMVSLNDLEPRHNDQIHQLIDETQTYTSEVNSVVNEIMGTLSVYPNANFIKMVEEGLRHLPDTITLGQSRLADIMGLEAKTHIERGKELQQLLMDSIELLRPAEKRPLEPLPRIWYNHAVLHDAYVEGVQNREIMARLYISEGTFNRTRRNAIRGLARVLIEKSSQ